MSIEEEMATSRGKRHRPRVSIYETMFDGHTASIMLTRFTKRIGLARIIDEKVHMNRRNQLRYKPGRMVTRGALGIASGCPAFILNNRCPQTTRNQARRFPGGRANSNATSRAFSNESSAGQLLASKSLRVGFLNSALGRSIPPDTNFHS